MAQEPTPSRPRSWLRWVGPVIVGATVAVVGLFAVQYVRAPTGVSLGSVAEGGSERVIAEADFQIDAAKDISDLSVLAEWRAARSDHKIVALAIANCERVGDTDIMPRNVFSALRLDLRPGGNYYITSRTSDVPATITPPRPVAAEPAGQPPVAAATPQKQFHLAGDEQTMLVLSDAAARARIAAADGASSNYPQVNLFGWYTVLISGLATLLITLKSSMNPRPRPPGGSSVWGDPEAWRNGMIVFLGIAAIICSTAGTVLNGVKQFYDPTAAYLRNTTALVKARKLHQEIALTFVGSWNSDNCLLERNLTGKVNEWSNTLAELQQQILKAAVPIPNLDAAPAPRNAPADNGSGNRSQPAGAAASPAQNSSAPPSTPPQPQQPPNRTSGTTR